MSVESAAGLVPPWPSLIITCGRRAIGPALEIARRIRSDDRQGPVRVVHIQHPHMDPRFFDLIVVPAHDRLEGENVEVTTGSVHAVTKAKLGAAAARWQDQYAAFSHPRLAVLIGGDNAAYRLDAETAACIGNDLRRIADETGGSAFATLSRRTGASAAAALQAALAPLGGRAEIWDGVGENPYHGYLALADRILVTADSVNMISEAASTGKPVQIIPLAVQNARRARKFERFHQAMIAANAARYFDGDLMDWPVAALNDTDRAAARIRKMFPETA